MISLSESYAHCRKVAKERAKNFYYSFVLLDEYRRNAMCAMYAFMRYCDDLSDEPGANRAAIEGWRRDMESALAGKPADNAIWPAFWIQSGDTTSRPNISAT
jgi:phytoene synthase